jgi:uncharacterized protein YndB with AHSA1/START domain
MSATTTINPVLEIRRLFDAPPHIAFDAWLEREQWQAWIGPEGCQCDVPLLEPKVGGRYRIQMHLSDGREIPVEGVFKIIDRPNTLAFTWGWALGGKGDTLVTLVFRAKGEQTEITLTHKGLATPEDREGHSKGWNSALNKLARYVKGETP